MIKLSEYIKRSGGMEKASRRLGISYGTVFRTFHGKTKPSDMLIALLKHYKIEVDTVEVSNDTETK